MRALLHFLPGIAGCVLAVAGVWRRCLRGSPRSYTELDPLTIAQLNRIWLWQRYWGLNEKVKRMAKRKYNNFIGPREQGEIGNTC